jgi:uncharacterized membrane protein
MEAKKHKFRDTDMQAVIGWVLRLGVIASISIVIFGGLVYLFRHGEEAPNHSKFTKLPDFVQLNGIVKGIFDFHGRSIIQAGIILLIATPIVRVIFSAISFVLEKDRLYILISLLVLLIIFMSSISGHIS